jgi:alpha-tubulin suppressor-like RCC1 family protein
MRPSAFSLRLSLLALLLALLALAPSAQAAPSISDASRSGDSTMIVTGTNLTAASLAIRTSAGTVRIYHPLGSRQGENPPEAAVIWSPTQISIAQDPRLQGQLIISVSIGTTAFKPSPGFYMGYAPGAVQLAAGAGNGEIHLEADRGLAYAPYVIVIDTDGDEFAFANPRSAQMSLAGVEQWTDQDILTSNPVLDSMVVDKVQLATSPVENVGTIQTFDVNIGLAPVIKALTRISVGSGSTCGINVLGTSYCWGLGTAGVLGVGSTSTALAPASINMSGVLAGKALVDVSVASSTSCAIANDGRAYCWGAGSDGQMGNGTNTASNLNPVAVSTAGVLAGKTLTKIYTGRNHVCAIDSAGKIYCWGAGTQGELGQGSFTSSNVPVAVNMSGVLVGKTALSIGMSAATCALMSDQKAYCWGSNGTGELGNGGGANSNVPVAVSTAGALAGKTLVRISGGASGGNSNCVLDSAGRAYCWGYPGTLGTGSSSGSNVPVAVDISGVLAGVTLTEISSGNADSCAVSSVGRAYCWGLTGSTHGDGTSTIRLSPVAVSTAGVLAGKVLTQIAVGDSHACAIDATETYCWGQGPALGNGSSSTSLVPVLVSELP